MCRKQPVTLDLAALAKQGLIQEGDIIVYKRTFPAQNLTVEKDLLVRALLQPPLPFALLNNSSPWQVDSINPTSHAITFLLSPGTRTPLHPTLLVSGSGSHAVDEDKTTLSMDDIADPIALERGVLDVDGRVSSPRKYEQDVAACPNALTPTGAPSDELKNLIAVRAWKAFTLWRWREEVRDQVEAQLLQERGARERVATLFYLRGCASGV